MSDDGMFQFLEPLSGLDLLTLDELAHGVERGRGKVTPLGLGRKLVGSARTFHPYTGRCWSLRRKKRQPGKTLCQKFGWKEGVSQAQAFFLLDAANSYELE